MSYKPIINYTKPATCSFESISFGHYPQTQVTDEDQMRLLQNSIWNEDVTRVRGESYTRRLNQAGKYVYFANEPIKWCILSEDDKTFFMVTDKVLDCTAFSNSATEHFKSSGIYNWLNEEFGPVAFNDDELADICTSRLDCGYCKLFILSVTDFTKENGLDLFHPFACEAEYSDYAKFVSNQELSDWSTGHMSYWLRNLDSEDTALRITSVGDLGHRIPMIQKLGVRVALRLNKDGWSYVYNDEKIVKADN